MCILLYRQYVSREGAGHETKRWNQEGSDGGNSTFIFKAEAHPPHGLYLLVEMSTFDTQEKLKAGADGADGADRYPFRSRAFPIASVEV